MHTVTDRTVAPASSIQGELVLPGDKSMSHRALLLALISDGTVHITNLAPSGDVRSTLDAVRALGAQVEMLDASGTEVRVTGVGLRGISGGTPDAPLVIDCGNAATLARLLPGILVGQRGVFELIGDASLSGRPMARIVEPLAAMGADIACTPQGTLPLRMTGGSSLASGEFELSIASAQVQSCLLLAGLFAPDAVSVQMPRRVRDHTQIMLRQAGVSVRTSGYASTVTPVERICLPDMHLPADPSSAAPFELAAILLHDSLLRLPGVVANPTRTGFVEQLERMGARVGILTRHMTAGEPVIDYEIMSGAITRAPIHPADVPRMIDELPLLALAAQFCKGETRIRGAAELRVKETDRIAATVHALRAIGVNAEELEDGMVVRGSGQRPEGGTIHSEGDHRIAMLGAVAGMASRRGVIVKDADCVDVSFPGFFDVIDALAVR
jgi:3-phosphoshikimate 1-carboxyvinyltransferase